MKKRLLLLLPLLPAQLFAQTFGVKAGAALATYSATGNTNNNLNFSRTNLTTSFKTGIIVGGYVDFSLTQSLALRTGLELVTKGGKEEGTYMFNGTSQPYSSRNNFTAFDIPVNLLYKKKAGSGHLLLGGGLVPGILIETGLNKLDLGLNVLAGYELSKGLNANMTYHHGIRNVGNQSVDYHSLTNRHVGFTVGYSFRRQTNAESSNLKTGTEEAITVSHPAKALYAELGGPGGFVSLNYDTRFTKSGKGLGLRAGAGLLFDPYGVGFSIPVALNYLAGKRAHLLELAAGASFFHFEEKNQDGWFDFTEESFLAPFVWAGYRYQPDDKKFVFRAGFTQFIGVEMPVFMRLPVPSLSFGYSIK
ncbi:MAG TPA: hypothetical protein VGB71_09695 [Flavisolibacter sp.]